MLIALCFSCSFHCYPDSVDCPVKNLNAPSTKYKTIFKNFVYFLGLEKINVNTFLILTLTGIVKLLKINTTIVNDVKFELQLVTNNIDWRPYCAQGLVRSSEGHIWGIVIFPAKIFDHLQITKPTEIVFCADKNLDPGKLLKENESHKLFNYWELLEIIR